MLRVIHCFILIYFLSLYKQLIFLWAEAQILLMWTSNFNWLSMCIPRNFSLHSIISPSMLRLSLLELPIPRNIALNLSGLATSWFARNQFNDSYRSVSSKETTTSRESEQQYKVLSSAKLHTSVSCKRINH